MGSRFTPVELDVQLGLESLTQPRQYMQEMEALEERERLLLADDDELMKMVKFETCRGSGRGGQKRNRTNSAVRVALNTQEEAFTGLSDDTRSQHDNRRIALRNLRMDIAKRWRCAWREEATPVVQAIVSEKNRKFPLWTARLLDLLNEYDYAVSDAARAINVSTGKLVKLLQRSNMVWETVNRERQQRNLRPLKAS